MSLYSRIIGNPFVFNHIRPLFVGGIDWTPLYRALDAGPDDVVLDVGCGTGIAHKYMRGFRAYYGFDTDPLAVDFARRNTTGPNVWYESRLLTSADVARIQPTKVLLSGLLHHLPDRDAHELLSLCGAPSVKSIATADTVYVPGEHVSNVLAFLDRGRHTRNRPAYLQLAERAGLRVVNHEIVRSRPTKGRALYLIMTLAP